MYIFGLRVMSLSLNVEPISLHQSIN